MLLNTLLPVQPIPSRRWRHLIVPLAIAFWGIACIAMTNGDRCQARLPVYDAKGNHLQFHITSVKTDAGELDLLRQVDAKLRITTDGDTLYFPESLIGKVALQVSLEDSNGATVSGRVPLMSCDQRSSLRSGQLDSGADVKWSSISGRFTGCSFVGDWWIRAVPMFGSSERSEAFDGIVRSDGSFRIQTSLYGVRHIITLGVNNNPVRTFAFDVVVGGKNDAGVIDVGSCPK